MKHRSAVRARRLFDGHTVHDGPAMILVENGMIADVDLSGAVPPDGVPLTDLGDVTLLPGLVDAHSHLVFDPLGHIEKQMLGDDDAKVLARMRTHAGQALRAGVTTVRDLGDRGYLALRLREEYEEGPHIVASGPPITRTGGHCWYLGGEADGAEQAVRAVTERARRGADLIKVMATGGMITAGSDPGSAQYTLAELRAITRTAHELGLRVTAHAHGASGIADAVTAGVDGIEHCTFITRSGVRPDPRTIDAMAEAGVFVGCTVLEPMDGMPTEMLAILESMWENMVAMQARGVRVVCCTDAGVAPFKPHDVLPRDLAYFASQVATNTAALASVTSLAADSCGLGHRKGRLASGYDADLLAVDGNPAHDIAAIRDVRAVYRAGRQVDRPEPAA
ncbi:amidohydrolase family protein [Streptomyces griseorubiginosus]|uniref:metal-dependent hydrolase family protein n=1 Tax=Streptomyces griseorubiginosus TaxID=67304 RepID=UPI00113FF450|nr:amidohydrolase family protein [Streptomyces griseorubiginosus]